MLPITTVRQAGPMRLAGATPTDRHNAEGSGKALVEHRNNELKNFM